MWPRAFSTREELLIVRSVSSKGLGLSLMPRPWAGVFLSPGVAGQT